jgi:hypothetical protein
MREDLRGLVQWSKSYHPEWDQEPERYVTGGVVAWGRSRRLGFVEIGTLKAYLGVQHVDPTRPGWGMFAEPQTRFFVSSFVGGTCVSLRTAATMDGALTLLSGFLEESAEFTE